MSDKTKNTKDIIYYIVAKDYMPTPLTWGNALFIIDDEGLMSLDSSRIIEDDEDETAFWSHQESHKPITTKKGKNDHTYFNALYSIMIILSLLSSCSATSSNKRLK